MSGKILLFLLMLMGLLGKSNVIATAACLLLVLELSSLSGFFPLLHDKGIELGLLFLLLAVLVPFADGRVKTKHFKKTFTSFSGIFGILGGIAATYMNGQGLALLQVHPELMLGIVIGSLTGIVFFEGQPVGPLMAAGIMAFLLEITHLLIK